MKKKILIEDIERMVREEVSKRLSEQQEIVDSKTMGTVRAARFSLYSSLRDDGFGTQQKELDKLKEDGVDLEELHRQFEQLAYRKWTPDIIAAVRASMKK